MTLGGSIKAGFSQETELNKKGRGGKKKRERVLGRGTNMCKGPEAGRGLPCARGQITTRLREGTASQVK